MSGMTDKERLREWLMKIRAETESANVSAAQSLGLLAGIDPENETDQPLDVVESDHLASLVVGKAEGKPGETVTVEILGGTQVPVKGFAIAIGCDPSLQLVKGVESQHLKPILGIDNIEDIKRQHRKGSNWSDNWIQLFVGFYEEIFGQASLDIDPSEVDPSKLPKKNRSAEVVIPPMTPLYEMHIKIPDHAEPKRRYTLDCENRYGHRLGSGSDGVVRFIHWTPLYGTSREVARTGIRGKDLLLVSGWIDVLEP